MALPIASGKLDERQPITRDIKPHGFRINRNRMAKLKILEEYLHDDNEFSYFSFNEINIRKVYRELVPRRRLELPQTFVH